MGCGEHNEQREGGGHVFCVMSTHSPAEARPARAKLPATKTKREDRECKTAGAWAAPSERQRRLDLPICPCAFVWCVVGSSVSPYPPRITGAAQLGTGAAQLGLGITWIGRDQRQQSSAN
jgi:hypothetical protein